MNDPINDPPTQDGNTDAGRPVLSREQIIRRFVEHWGMMARAWGINATMGELFAVLYITGTEWTADDLCEWLQVSRGNVSMNLRELMSWGVVHKIHRAGERREFFRAEADVSTLFRRILLERKRRELDPTLQVLECTVSLLPAEPAEHLLRERLSTLLRFFSLIDRLATRIVTLEPDDLEELRQLFEETDPASFV